MKWLILGVLFFCTPFSYGQTKKSPRNLMEAMAILPTDCPDSLKAIIQRTPNDSLRFLCTKLVRGGYKTIRDWTDTFNKKTKLWKYLSHKGISDWDHQQLVTMIAFKQTMLEGKFDETAIFLPFQAIERKWAHEDSLRATADSLRGIYIPQNLEDCFRQIDGFWSDSIKLKVRQMSASDFSANAHFGIGMWMRNNWQLWRGSRLSLYFKEMGIFHPDDMSGIILDSYYRYLTGAEIGLDAQIQFYKEYWEKAKLQRSN